MKKFVLALTTLAAFTGSALAADMAPRTYSKAPEPVAPVASWTGCFVGAGGGGGMFSNNSHLVTNPAVTPPGSVRASTDLTQGGQGWLATVQAGCDYQFALGQFGNRFVIGAFADGDWTNIAGDHTGDTPGRVGLSATDKQTINNQWAVGARAGYLVTPSLLTYVTAGYTQAQLSGSTYRDTLGVLTGDNISSQTYHGWFIGTGDEYKLDFLPGLFWKTEYRFSEFGSKDVPVVFNATGLPNGFLEHTHIYENSIRSELVYRFNWSGPVIAKY